MIPRALDLIAESLAKLSINLETAWTDRRTHRRANVRRASTKLDHRVDAHASDVRDNAAPSGMQRAGYFAFRIDHQYRHAIGRKYSEHHAGLCRDNPITRRPQSCSITSRRVNDIAMHLVQPRDDLERRHLAT